MSRFAAFFGLILVMCQARAEVTEGWLAGDDYAERHTEPLSRIAVDDIGSFRIEWRDGATGTVAVVRRDGRSFLGIRKINDCGAVVVTAGVGLSFPEKTRLQTVARCESDNSDNEYSYGFLAVWSGKENLSCMTTGPYGRGGPRMTQIVNTPPGTGVLKLSHGIADGAEQVFAAIVVAGRASTSLWSDWRIEDRTKAEKEWARRIRDRRPPWEENPDRVSDDDFSEFLKSAPDHTAQVRRLDGYSEFLIDGVVRQPVFYKSIASVHALGFNGGSKMAAAGMDLQTVSLRLGATKFPAQGRGYWSAEGFDVTGAVAAVRRQMKAAMNAKYLLCVGLSAYPEFCDEHPGETWINDYGRRVFGHQCHSAFSLPKEMGPADWYWPSIYSGLYRAEIKARLSELVAELKRVGMSKLIVGVHLGGYHDGQFATVHPDYSPCAVAEFRKWLKRKYGTVEALRKAWRCDSAAFDTAAPSVFRHTYGRRPYFVLPEDRAVADFAEFQKCGPFAVQEEFARHLKKEFAKPIVAVRYCMSPFGGSFCSAYDIEPFLKSDAIDILCAQPDYGRRVPGVPMTCVLPLSSFHRHGKVYFDEFDLRTYGALTAWETEVATMSYSKAVDDAMFAVINRKLAGQMYARRMGWWYYDMAGGWFAPEGIVGDISDMLDVGRKLKAAAKNNYRADVAFVMDEKGALLRNTFSQYYNPDETVSLGRQMHTLAAAGVPADSWELQDWLDDPSLGDRYRMVVFLGLYDVDGKRAALLKRLRSKGRTLVFTAGSGFSAGMENLGFKVSRRLFPAQHETRSEIDGLNMNSLLHTCKIVRFMGVSSGWLWQLNSPARLYLEEAPGQKTVSRFVEDGTAAVAERREKDAKTVYVAAYGGLTPDYFRLLAEECGAYLPFDKPGVQVDMNGNFISIHCLRSGGYKLRLPFPAALVNLKTGKHACISSRSVGMRLTAGETRWYQLIADNLPHCKKER